MKQSPQPRLSHVHHSLTRLPALMAALAFASACASLPEVFNEDDSSAVGDGDGDGDDGDDEDGGDGDNNVIIMGGSGNGNGDGDGDGDGLPMGVCGNGELEALELCDDGNTRGGDGCNKTCSVVDEDFLCGEPGTRCERVVTCGNSVIEGTEACDDGNKQGGDGCAADCKSVDPTFICIKPGQPCVPVPVCGNGLRERGEQCDDAQETPVDDDGCSATCQEEDPDAWFCPPGSPCIPKDCGDGNRTPDEFCDDGENEVGDGCDQDCNVEPGWRCGSSGCRPICGDLMMVTGEECDDGNLLSGDGCSAACLEENFYTCPGVPGACISDIECGDGCVDPGEICDPGGDGDPADQCPDANNECKSIAEDPGKACRGFDLATDPGVCGDGVVNLNEECDPDCSVIPCDIPGCTGCEVDTDWSCPGPGYCFRIPRCGDGFIQIGEECDPGMVSTGCDMTDCSLRDNYYCSGQPSVCEHSVCGDGYVATDEQCDDGPGTVPGVAGSPVVNGDGCSTTCTVESGYVCPPGLDCQPVCGSNTGRQPGEQCDDNNTNPNDGCDNCAITPGYTCNAGGTSCSLADCGNATPTSNLATAIANAERGEGCDDGNAVAGDGCSPTCQIEPTFTHSSVGTPTNSSPACGDGFKTLTEDCDDGNRTDGDGCSSSCVEEYGWDCDEEPVDYADFPTIDFKVTYRDFVPRPMDGGHPHFRDTDQGSPNPDTGADVGIPGQLCTTGNYDTSSIDASHCGLLNSSGKPRGFNGPGNTNNVSPSYVSLWFADSNTTLNNSDGELIKVLPNPGLAASPNTPIFDTLELTHQGGGVYSFDSGAAEFFQLDGRGYGNNPDQDHNYNFTTELRYFFQFQGGESLTFRGDDDVWVFINGRLAIDVGGIHCAHRGRVVLGDEDGSCNLYEDNLGCAYPYSNTTACAPTQTELDLDRDNRFGLTEGNVYEIVLFHAERNPTGSNFKLDLGGFLAPRSTCSTECGDGERGGNEICDTDSSLTSGYNVCLSDCSINFCGDGELQNTFDAALGRVPEFCDTPTKVTYQANGNGCGFDCQRAPYCGDGTVQAGPDALEVCDDGVNDGSYGSCTPDCKGFGGYCGDGIPQTGGANPPEDCDTPTKVPYDIDGNGCGYDCRWAPSCGDGVLNGEETCEPPGTPECDDLCQIQPFCGDGIRSPDSEDCDYGTFNKPPMSVEYSGCTTDCELGPHCGDGTMQSEAGEECDDGEMNSLASDPAYNSCTTVCLRGPRCGDGITRVGEEDCDNGFNEDTYAYSIDACGPNCTAVPYCGDGILDPAIEQCDYGTAENNDETYDGCTTTCLWGPYCGDGVQNGNEECDDPEGNVAYSPDGQGCSYECTNSVPYCGDGVRNGPELCDNGSAANVGGYGGCNEDCTPGPYCGDGIKNGDEACDAGASGSLTCLQNCTRRKVVQ